MPLVPPYLGYVLGGRGGVGLRDPAAIGPALPGVRVGGEVRGELWDPAATEALCPEDWEGEGALGYGILLPLVPPYLGYVLGGRCGPCIGSTDSKPLDHQGSP